MEPTLSAVAPSVADVFARIATPVSVVTTSAAGEPYGMTVSSFCSVSLRPALLLVCLGRKSRTGAIISEVGSFGLNVLGSDHADVADRFAAPLDRAARFRDVRWRWEGDVPLLLDALVSVYCLVERVSVAGDHLIFVAKPTLMLTATGRPLLRHEQRYRTTSRPARPGMSPNG